MNQCNHAASGCNFPEGDCTGACLEDPRLVAARRMQAVQAETARLEAVAARHTSQRPQFLTVVYQVHSIGHRAALLHATDHVATSDSDAISQRDELMMGLNHYREGLNHYRETALRLVIERDDMLQTLQEAELVLAEKLRRTGADPMVSPTYQRIRATIARVEGGQV